MQNCTKSIYSLCHLCKSHFTWEIFSPLTCNNNKNTYQILLIPKNGKYKYSILQTDLFPLLAVSARVSSTETRTYAKTSHNLGWLAESWRCLKEKTKQHTHLKDKSKTATSMYRREILMRWKKETEDCNAKLVSSHFLWAYFMTKFKALHFFFLNVEV